MRTIGERSKWGQRGVTLVELLVVLAIVGVFAIITIPAFRDFMNAFKVKSTAVQIRDVVRLGRQIAVAKKSQVVAAINKDDEVYDVWEDDDEDETKDAGEDSVRPVPPVPRLVDIKEFHSNVSGKDPIGVSEMKLLLQSDGTVRRNGCDPSTCTESQWCISVEMEINTSRADHWTVFIKQSGKATLRYNEDDTNSGYCKW